MHIRFEFDRIVDRKQRLEEPFFVRSIVKADDRIELASLETAIAKSSDMIVPLAVDLVCAPKES